MNKSFKRNKGDFHLNIKLPIFYGRAPARGDVNFKELCVEYGDHLVNAIDKSNKSMKKLSEQNPSNNYKLRVEVLK